MIYDTLNRLDSYAALSPGLAEAITLFYKQNALASLPLGRTDYSERVYFNVQEYEPKAEEECRFEAHRDYIDIQILLEGKEFFYTAPVESLIETEPYSTETDCCFFSGKAQTEALLLPGTFVIAFPSDAHKPCVRVEKGVSVRKIVIKVKVL